MTHVLGIGSRQPLDSLEHTVRNLVARDEGQVLIFAEPGGFRNLRRLERRLENGPVAGGEMYLARMPAIDGSGGMLAASATPFPESS